MVKKFTYNLHTHTYRCRHAFGDVDAYVYRAHKSGLSLVGISDHCPLPTDWWKPIRMSLDEFPGYVKAINKAKHMFDDVTVLAGIECELFQEFYSFYDELKEQYNLDYLVGSPHGFRDDEGKHTIYERTMTAKDQMSYANEAVIAMESKKYDILAHPDLYMDHVEGWDNNTEACAREIIDAAIQTGQVLELNTSGYDKKAGYPNREFWTMACEAGVKLVMNSDAHYPEKITANFDLGVDLVNSIEAETGKQFRIVTPTVENGKLTFK
jgi:histidinol-phosphatase (PHP family)